jgi:hypothetical protein
VRPPSASLDRLVANRACQVKTLCPHRHEVSVQRPRFAVRGWAMTPFFGLLTAWWQPASYFSPADPAVFFHTEPPGGHSTAKGG